MLNLSKKVHNFAHQNNLFKKRQKILVGVSGGADSVCLLHILLELKKKYDFLLHVAHVNYSLRGEDSEKDQKFVEDLAEKHGIGVDILVLDKPKETANLENKLRNQRYEFFEQTRRSLKFDAVAVAHSQDDQAETVLMRIIRGSGLQGLSSMKGENGTIIRPLLKTSRKEIEKYLKEKGIIFRVDSTNKESIFLRNKVRLELIPYLEENFNSNARETLSKMAESIGLDYDYITSQAKKSLRNINMGKNKTSFSCEYVLKMHPAIRKELFREIIRNMKGDLVDIDVMNIEEMEKVVNSSKNKVQKIAFKGLKIEKRGAIVTVLY